MQKELAAAVVAAVLFSTGCETMGGAVATGGATGAALGAGAGALAPAGDAQGRIRNVVIGTAAGTALGSAAGYFTEKNVQDREKSSFDKGKADGQKAVEDQTTQTSEPVLLPPKVEAHFVPDQVRGNVFIPAHYEYRIVEPARWSK